MAGNITQKFGSANQALTITLNSKANGVAQESTAVDNSSDQFEDVHVTVKWKSGGSGTSTAGVVYVYAYASTDGGTTFSDNASGANNTITLTVPPNMRLIGLINVVANSTSYVGGPFSVASAFGGAMPAHWGIVVENESGGTSDATGGNFSAVYQGVYSQYT